jgi:tRNA1(Val) A37 N6-methylase TrmN6
MINKNTIIDLISKYDIPFIEKHLIYSFVSNKNLDPKDSSIISDFLFDFNVDPQIHTLISSLKIENIKQLENYLELLIPKEDRKLNGAFFTPNYVIDFIIKETAPKENEKCLDPSCGCGAFLIGLVDYYKNTFNKSIKNIIQENIFGADILDYNIKRAKIILSIYGLLHNEIIESKDFNLYHQDSLKVEWDNRFEVIVGNPPYVKYQDLSDENREYLIRNWKTIENGTFNLYFAFFELGYKLLTKNGRLGYITPNNYFTSLAGLSLRQFFLNTKSVRLIADFRHKKVFDAQTYTATTFMNRKENEAILYDKIEDDQNTDEFLFSVNGSPNYLSNLNVKKWRLLKTDEQENIKIIETIGTPIKQLFNIAVGIATLKDDVFFVDSKYEKNDLLKKVTENGTFYIEKGITKPVYKISNFKLQEEIKNNTLRIITPYKIINGSAISISENVFQEKYPYCYEYLISEKDKLNNRDKGKIKYSPFYVWGRTQGIARTGTKILSPTFSKHPRFLLVEEEDAYYTNGYGIYFNKDNNINQPSLFDNFINPFSKEENIELVQKIMNSIVMDYYVTKTSVSIQGGYPCYQKNFIEKFTIPEFTDEELNILRKLQDKTKIDEFLIEKYQINIQSPNLVL